MTIVTCPRCGLPCATDPTDRVEGPNCNPIRSPGCWQMVAKLPKADSPERRIIERARKAGLGGQDV